MIEEFEPGLLSYRGTLLKVKECQARVYFLYARYSLVQINSSMFVSPAFLPPTNLGLPMHSPSALTKHVSLNLARFFLLDPV